MQKSRLLDHRADHYVESSLRVSAPNDAVNAKWLRSTGPLRHGLTHRGEDRPAASRHGSPHWVRLRGGRLSPFASGNGPLYHEAGCRCP
jgi:hypothetical protein